MLETSKSLIRAENVYKYVMTGNTLLYILSEINLKISPQETVAIRGVSGSGKSTLLGLLAGLDVPSSGRIFFEHSEISRLSEDERALIRARQVGFIFQSFQLIQSMTALENVMLPLELLGIEDAQNQAEEWLSEVGLNQRLRHYPNQLSGGEQQRVAIARAFAVKPRILFADEPTGNLDKKTGAQIIDLLFSLHQDYSTTLVVITHDDLLAQRCQRTLVLDGGYLQ